MSSTANTTTHEHGIIDRAVLMDMVKRKDLHLLSGFNGVRGLASVHLRTNLENGISNGEDTETRRSRFGSNSTRKHLNSSLPKSFAYCLLEAFMDASKLLQLAFTVISLGLMIKQERLKQVWYDGGSIAVSLLVIALEAVINFIQHKQLLCQLSKISDNVKIDVVRDGWRQKISVEEVVVGDVVLLSVGDQVPAGGLFIEGDSLLVDEYSDDGGNVIDIDTIRSNPFLISGSKVINGNARMLVLSVGRNALDCGVSPKTGGTHDSSNLHSLLNKLTSLIAKVACFVSFVDLLGILIRYFCGNNQDDPNGIDIPFVLGNVAAIAEGLSLAFTFNLVYSSKGMMDDRVMIRKFSACETIGAASVICTHRTGILTGDQMEVKEFCVGFDQIEDGSVIVAGDDKFLRLFRQGVGLNTTGGGGVHNSFEDCGSPTERAILSWAVENLEMEMAMEKLTEGYIFLRHAVKFDSEMKRSGVSILKKEDNTIDVHWKGDAKGVLAMCSNYYQKTGVEKSINDDEKTRLENMIEGMAASGLRCIGFAHKRLPQNEDGGTYELRNEEGLTLLCIVGIKDSCKQGVKEAIASCKSAGVEIKMITEDHALTAKALAIECGILAVDPEVSNNGEEVIEGKEFRNYTEKERMDKVERIRVMARSSPSDKLLMVECLKKKGHVVAFTGHDAPALKEADIGVSMGIEGTAVAKEISDVVILDDGFASVVMGLKWGRWLFDNIQKHIQFQLPANVASLVINFISTSAGRGVPLSTIQMLWINLLMVTLGGLALAREKPTKELMLQKPPPVGSRVARLVTNVMWRNILAQSMYQIVIVLMLWFKGRSFFNVNERVKNTITFNTFVFCQWFNLFNSRIQEKMNIFEDLHKNIMFLGIVGAAIVLQVVIVEFLNLFADNDDDDDQKLNWKFLKWGICVATATISWLIGWFVKLIPMPHTPSLADLDRIRVDAVAGFGFWMSYI